MPRCTFFTSVFCIASALLKFEVAGADGSGPQGAAANGGEDDEFASAPSHDGEFYEDGDSEGEVECDPVMEVRDVE